MTLQIAKHIIKNEPTDILRNFAPVIVPDLSRLHLLTENEKEEVLGFLAQRPVHTVVMTSMIHDNGIENAQNRGKFFGYRNASDILEGVALIGHTTLVEVHTEEALKALALIARESETPIHVMMSDGNSIESFWQHFSGGIKEPRLVCSERLFEISFPLMVRNNIDGLRLASETELLPIAEAHAEVAFEESGVDPLVKDREGFLKRVTRRINQERVWVVFDAEGKLVFKADVVAETPEVKYLEGIYVHPEYRGKGIAADCLSQLSRKLLEEVQYVCLLSNEEFQHAHRTYMKAGFKSQDSCVTIFV